MKKLQPTNYQLHMLPAIPLHIHHLGLPESYDHREPNKIKYQLIKFNATIITAALTMVYLPFRSIRPSYSVDVWLTAVPTFVFDTLFSEGFPSFWFLSSLSVFLDVVAVLLLLLLLAYLFLLDVISLYTSNESSWCFGVKSNMERTRRCVWEQES